MATLLHRLSRVLRHGWRSRTLPSQLRGAALERLTQKVAQSEQAHSGQVRLCLEGGLPPSYLWRGARARERAVTLFGKLRIWDTEHNNGVLIYLLLADRAVEIVADRGVARCVAPQQWERVVASMAERLKSGEFEQALNCAIDEVSALLQQHFPAPACLGDDPGNELPDAPVIRP